MTRHDESVASGAANVLAEHRAVRQVLARLRAAAQFALGQIAATEGHVRPHFELEEALGEFASAAQAHFAAEEAPGAFFEDVAETAPRHQAVLDDLRDQHGAILEEAARLTRDLADERVEGIADIVGSVLALVDLVESHEAAENEILLEAMNTDLGAGD